MDNSTVAWFLTRFPTGLCAHNCFPPELLRVFPSGRIRKYSFECPVSKRSSVFCLWVDGFCFFVKPIWHGGRWRVKRFKWPISLAFRDNLGKNWDLTKEKLRPRSGLYLWALQWAYLVSSYPCFWCFVDVLTQNVVNRKFDKSHKSSSFWVHEEVLKQRLLGLRISHDEHAMVVFQYKLMLSMQWSSSKIS